MPIVRKARHVTRQINCIHHHHHLNSFVYVCNISETSRNTLNIHNPTRVIDDSVKCTHLKLKLKFPFFYSDSYRDNSENRARFTFSDRHAGMTLGGIAAPGGDLWRV